MNTSPISIVEEAWALRNSDRAAVRRMSEALLASTDADPRVHALAKVALCYINYRERRYERAAAGGLEALTVLEANPTDSWLPRLYNTLAIIHFDLGERVSSRTYLDQQIRLSQQLGDHLYEAFDYHDLGLLQAAAKPQRGLDTLTQALAMFATLGDAENQALTLYNMANIYQHMQERELAATYADQALRMLHTRSTHGLAQYMSIYIATHMAENASSLGLYSKAQVLLDEARALVVDHRPEALAHFQLCQGSLFVATGNDQDALEQFQDVLVQTEASGNYELVVDCYLALSGCCERLGNYRAALEYYRAYTKLHQRTFSEQSEQKVRALDVIHHVEAARQAAEVERKRNAELQQYVTELEQLQATLRSMSLRDPLTSLYNRRYLTEEGEQLLHDAQRQQSRLCAAMIDIDHFKQINDELGHQVGDLVLQHMATLITTAMRSTDLITRYGGEELAVLLPATCINSAYAICERLRITIEQHRWSNIHPRLRVTVSIGLAEDRDNTLADLLAQADIQLYASKRAGRNRTSYGVAVDR